MEKLTAGSDIVIVDSPPLQAVTDAAILSSLTDGTLFVVDAGRTRRAAVRSGFATLSKSGAHVLGAVLNRLSSRATGDYYYYDYYGGSQQPDKADKSARGTGDKAGPKSRNNGRRNGQRGSDGAKGTPPAAPEQVPTPASTSASAVTTSPAAAAPGPPAQP